MRSIVLFVVLLSARAIAQQPCEVFRDEFNGSTVMQPIAYPFGDHVCGFPNYVQFVQTTTEFGFVMGCADEAEMDKILDLPYAEYMITLKWRSGADTYSGTDCTYAHFDEEYKATCNLSHRLIVINDTVFYEKSGMMVNVTETVIRSYKGSIKRFALAVGTGALTNPYETFFDSVVITARYPLSADFSVQNTAVTKPTKFSDLSKGVPKTLLWNFGDGDTSTARDPQHPYAAAGTYSVKLKITDYCNKTDSIVKDVVITDSALSVSDAESLPAYSVSAFPNPFGTETRISINNYNGESYSFIMYDLFGRQVKKLDGLKSKEIILSRVGLVPGMYFYEILGNITPAQGKIVVE